LAIVERPAELSGDHGGRWEAPAATVRLAARWLISTTARENLGNRIHRENGQSDFLAPAACCFAPYTAENRVASKATWKGGKRPKWRTPCANFHPVL
jgi:hypothetical protein